MDCAFYSISRRFEDEAHLILTDTVCGLPCLVAQIETARDLLFEETGWKHIDTNVGNGFLGSSGQRAILIDFEDAIPPNSNGVTLSVDVSSDNDTVHEPTPTSPGSVDKSSLAIRLNKCLASEKVTRVFYLTASSRRKLGNCPLGIQFQYSIMPSRDESSGRIVVIDVTRDGYMWNLGLQVVDEVILDLLSGPVKAIHYQQFLKDLMDGVLRQIYVIRAPPPTPFSGESYHPSSSSPAPTDQCPPTDQCHSSSSSAASSKRVPTSDQHRCCCGC